MSSHMWGRLPAPNTFRSWTPALQGKAIQLLQAAIGAAGNYLSHPFQRRFRDMHAAAAQVQVNFDINGAEFGRVALGLDPVNKAI